MNEVEVRNIGTPFYVFDIDVLKKRINYLKSMMPSNVELCYAMKANPFVVKKIEDVIKKYEICSYGEWSIAHGLMVDGSKMVISGVYKNEEEMIDIINNKSNGEVFTVESVNQLKLLDKITKDKKVFIDCILRLTSGNQFGMTEEEIEHIFQSFYRGSNTRDYAGQGIGLSLTLKIISAYHAKLDISSEIEKGTKVRVIF